MRFQCNHCRALLELEDVEPGEIVQCPTCLSPVAVPDSVTSPRALLGDFVIKSLIGSGGMGIVYLAHQVTLDRDVALKVLHADFSSDTGFIQNFINEARAAASLNHPNIVQAVAVNCDEGRWYFAMEYINGSTLKQMLEENGRIEQNQMLGIVSEVVSALKYAWNEKRIVHRDIKPDNIMITADGHAKLADLGLARKITELHEDGSTELFGTPQYIAPELLMGATPNAASDIYSLGATLYHAVSGRFPFMADTPEEIANLHLSAPLVPLKDVVADISEPLSRLVSIMMSKSPDERYQDYEELEQDLELVKNDKMPLHKFSTETSPDEAATEAEATSTKHGKAKLKLTKGHAKLHKTKTADDVPAPPPPQDTTTSQNTPDETPKAAEPAVTTVTPASKGNGLFAIYAILAVLIVAIASAGTYFFLRGNKAQPPPNTPSSSTGDSSITESSALQPDETIKEEEKTRKEEEEKARKEMEEKRIAEEKAKQEAEQKALEEKARLEAEAKNRKEAEEKAQKEAEEKRIAEQKARLEAEEKARKEAEIKARQEAIAAEKTKRIETALHEVAARDFSGAREAFFSRIEHEEPADKAWRNQWEQALTLAESFWDGLKDAAPKLTGTQINDFSMNSIRQKFLKNNFTEHPWTIADMTGDTLVLRHDFETAATEDGKETKTIQWTRKLQELRFSQIEALAQTIGALPDKALNESEQACGLYLLLCGVAPAKSIIEKYKLDETWPSITSEADSISPQTYIATQLSCIKERAETATSTKEPLIRILSSIQAYSLGNALYMTFPNKKELYASEVQQIVRPLFTQQK